MYKISLHFDYKQVVEDRNYNCCEPMKILAAYYYKNKSQEYL